MTNEEAIKLLNFERGYFCDLKGCQEQQAFTMAIKALKQEPCEDAISRQAVLDGLASIAKAKAKSDAQKALIGRVMFFTEQLPPVTPLPKGYEMREATTEELECVNNYIKSISKPTGVNFWDEIEKDREGGE